MTDKKIDVLEVLRDIDVCTANPWEDALSVTKVIANVMEKGDFSKFRTDHKWRDEVRRELASKLRMLGDHIAQDGVNSTDLKVSLNVSRDFVPNLVTIGDFLIDGAKLITKLGEELNQTDSCDLELEAEKLGLNVEGKLDITGTY